MRKIESLSIRYVGYKDPSTSEEVELELLGLQTAIAAAKQRMAVLKQGLYLRGMSEKDAVNEETVTETPAEEKAE